MSEVAQLPAEPTVPAAIAPKPKLLWISDSPDLEFIGQSIVTRNCLNGLKEFYDVTVLGFGAGEVPNPVPCPYPIIPCTRVDLLDPKKTVELISKANPDVVLFSHDPWLWPTVGIVKAHLPKIKYIGYLTVDGEPAYYAWRPFLTPYDKIICPCNFSKRTLEERWVDLWIDVVPYGIDHKTFHYPAQGKEALKQQLHQAYAQQYGNWLNLTNKFVGIFAGANQDRKNLGLMIEGWTAFEKGKEYDVVLMCFVHSASLKEEAGSYDLAVFLQQSKTMKIINQPVPTEVIGQFMAASDVLVHMSAGEGFGLTAFEAAACGTVPVILNYAALSDHFNNGNAYPVPHILHVGGHHVHRALSSADNLKYELEKAFADRQELQQKSVNAVGLAQQFTWERTISMLKAQIDEVLSYDHDCLYVKRVV